MEEEEEKQDEEARKRKRKKKGKGGRGNVLVKRQGEGQSANGELSGKAVKILLSLSSLEAVLCNARFLVTGANGRFLQLSLSPEA